jgi:hypothetical protein
MTQTAAHARGIVFAAASVNMFKTSTFALNKVNIKQISAAFTDHLPVTVKKINGETVGPGFIAILYGSVAFRMYPKTDAGSSHFVRLEEIVEISVGTP